MPPSTHSALGASKAGQWLNCPGSVRLLKTVPKKESKYAQDGTAQHYVAEQCLTKNRNAAYYQGRKINVETSSGVVGIEFTDDHARAVQVYLDTVRKDTAETPGAVLEVEKKFHLDWLHPDLYGTNDANQGVPFGTLRVYDYKGGRKAVEPVWNPQLMYYALGAIGQGNPKDYDEVELVIVQPNGEGPAVKRWSCKTEVVLNWADTILVPKAKAALEPDAPCIAGPWCEKHFCDAMAVCPAIREKANIVARQVFTPVATNAPAPALPAPAGMSKEQILAVLIHGDMVCAWIDEVRGYVHRKIEAGEDPTDGAFKLVRGKANRKMSDKAEVELAKYLKARAYEQKLIGVTEAEKRLSKELGWEKADVKAFMEQITERPEGKLLLAPEADSRPAVQVGPLFTPVENNNLDWL